MYFTSASFTTLCLISLISQSHASSETHMRNARLAAQTLQETWYNGQTGLYNSTGWWNAANAITALADMSAVNPNVIHRTTAGIFKNTFNQAQLHNLGVLKFNATHECDGISDVCPNVKPKVISRKGFLNSYFDDQGWWALAWITVWDFTKDDAYLDAATDIFNDIVNTGTNNGTCGGVWWRRKHDAVNAITNELFLSVAAHLANRKPNGDYYRRWALRQHAWFLRSGLINSKGNINDGLDLKTCKNAKDNIWTYNQGAILGALVELDRMDPKNGSYIPLAKRIADAALTNRQLVDSRGILHDSNEPSLGASGATFKGVFIRNLGILNARSRTESYRIFIQNNAEAVWARARSAKNHLGPVWSGPPHANVTNAATHVSALEALVAASTLREGVGGFIGAFMRALRPVVGLRRLAYVAGDY